MPDHGDARGIGERQLQQRVDRAVVAPGPRRQRTHRLRGAGDIGGNLDTVELRKCIPPTQQVGQHRIGGVLPATIAAEHHRIRAVTRRREDPHQEGVRTVDAHTASTQLDAETNLAGAPFIRSVEAVEVPS